MNDQCFLCSDQPMCYINIRGDLLFRVVFNNRYRTPRWIIIITNAIRNILWCIVIVFQYRLWPGFFFWTGTIRIRYNNIKIFNCIKGVVWESRILENHRGPPSSRTRFATRQLHHRYSWCTLFVLRLLSNNVNPRCKYYVIYVLLLQYNLINYTITQECDNTVTIFIFYCYFFFFL